MSTSSSCSSLSDLVTELVTENEKRRLGDHGHHEVAPHQQQQPQQRRSQSSRSAAASGAMLLPSGLDVTAVFKPPKKLVVRTFNFFE